MEPWEQISFNWFDLLIFNKAYSAVFSVCFRAKLNIYAFWIWTSRFKRARRLYCRKAGLELPATRPVLSAQPELKAFSEFNQITAC